jgi:hypothetical protein
MRSPAWTFAGKRPRQDLPRKQLSTREGDVARAQGDVRSRPRHGQGDVPVTSRVTVRVTPVATMKRDRDTTPRPRTMEVWCTSNTGAPGEPTNSRCATEAGGLGRDRSSASPGAHWAEVAASRTDPTTGSSPTTAAVSRVGGRPHDPPVGANLRRSFGRPGAPGRRGTGRAAGAPAEPADRWGHRSPGFGRRRTHWRYLISFARRSPGCG